MKSRHTHLADCELSTRTFNALTQDGFKTIGEVAEKPDKYLLMIPNFGTRCLQEIRNIQHEYLSTDEPDILTVLKGYRARAYKGGIFMLSEHLEMAVLEIENLRGQHE